GLAARSAPLARGTRRNQPDRLVIVKPTGSPVRTSGPGKQEKKTDWREANPFFLQQPLKKAAYMKG
ncbi:MAG: hypothetical protein ACLFS0_09495, partial [Bacteroidales bacterium]